MPRFIAFTTLAAVLLFAAPASAKGVSADLRVVGDGGKVLAEKTLRASANSVPTSPRATCFGKGTGGSGKPAQIDPSTALSLLGQAAKSTASLRPLAISDAFDFGLALCGVGDSEASATKSWYLKVNHENPELGGELVKLHPGDEVLWALEPFPYPDELSLSAPDKAMAATPFEVRVFSYDEKGKRKPAAGVEVTGAAAPTGADGRATVTLTKPMRLIARHGKDIPSNREAVCVGGKCPRG